MGILKSLNCYGLKIINRRKKETFEMNFKYGANFRSWNAIFKSGLRLVAHRIKMIHSNKKMYRECLPNQLLPFSYFYTFVQIVNIINK
jgi:hypothetical protein